MFVHDLFRLSFHNLLLHKIRSFLTSLGIIFGVGSVIAMLAISEGAKRQSLAQIEALGIDKILVFSKKPAMEGKDESNTENASVMKSYGLTVLDRKHIRKMDNIARITAVRDARKKILKGTTRLDIKLVATSQTFLEDTNSIITEGRWLSNVDEHNATNVCVLGANVKRKLFTLGKKAIGGKIRIEGSLFTVVGILENTLGTQFPDLNSPNDMIYIPESTSMALFGFNAFVREGRAKLEITHIEFDLLIVKIMDLAFIDNTSRRISNYLSKVHDKVKDWGLIVPLDLLKQREQTQNIFTVVMGSIAGISLIVGGVGIMNIMLANVYERKKEIGTRRALGAKKKDILFQFLIETVFLTSIGGLLGICLGLGISEAVTYYAAWPTVYSLWSILLSLFISAFVGIVFGTYPAWKAAQQNPIEVLRAE
jgi:putative ABC transport system permease protein